MVNFLRMFHFFKKRKLNQEEIEPEDKPVPGLSVTDIYQNSKAYYDKENLVFFPHLNAYGVFRYDVVKDILTNNQDIGISDIHLSLNNIYFSKDAQIHKENKKSTIRHLTFLSSRLQYSDNEYTKFLFDIFVSNFPMGEQFDLAGDLVNPIIFIGILKEYDLLEEVFADLNPADSTFSAGKAIELVKYFIGDSKKLEAEIHNHIAAGGNISPKMQSFIDDLIPENKVELEHIPKFLVSFIFVGVETTASFVCSLIYTLFTKYPGLINETDNQSKIYEIANELLRIYTPVPFIYRAVLRDTEYLGFDLKKGTNLILFLGAANMDPRVFNDPDEIRSNRSEKHLSFGSGGHSCIGRYASYRMAINILSYLSPHEQRIIFTDKNAKHFFHNSIQKLPLNVVYSK